MTGVLVGAWCATCGLLSTMQRDVRRLYLRRLAVYLPSWVLFGVLCERLPFPSWIVKGLAVGCGVCAAGLAAQRAYHDADRRDAAECVRRFDAFVADLDH